jgi:elongation factor 1-beta
VSNILVNVASKDLDFMAEVILGLKVMPKSSDVDLDKLESQLKTEVNPERMQREPIAFGLIAILITVVVEDAEGVMDKVEERIRSIPDVGEVEVTGMTRSL